MTKPIKASAILLYFIGGNCVLPRPYSAKRAYLDKLKELEKQIIMKKKEEEKEREKKIRSRKKGFLIIIIF